MSLVNPEDGVENVRLKTFSFRAECPADVDTFCLQLKATKPFQSSVRAELLFFADWRLSGEAVVEINTSLELEDLRNIMRGIDDSHVMVQTLRELPISKNNMACDRNVN